jgi:hypothetical protein
VSRKIKMMDHRFAESIRLRWTSKMRVEFGGIKPGKPLAPYAILPGMVNLAFSPSDICGTPLSQPINHTESDHKHSGQWGHNVLTRNDTATAYEGFEITTTDRGVELFAFVVWFAGFMEPASVLDGDFISWLRVVFAIARGKNVFLEFRSHGEVRCGGSTGNAIDRHTAARY